MHFRTSQGFEKRDLSTYCAAVYSILAPFVQFGPQLLYSTLVSFLREPMEKAFAAFAVLESRVYAKWAQDKENRKPATTFADLYFLNTEFLPLISLSFLPRMGVSGRQIETSLTNVLPFSPSFSRPAAGASPEVHRAPHAAALRRFVLRLHVLPHVLRAALRARLRAAAHHAEGDEAAAIHAEAGGEADAAVLLRHDAQGVVHGATGARR